MVVTKRKFVPIQQEIILADVVIRADWLAGSFLLLQRLHEIARRQCADDVAIVVKQLEQNVRLSADAVKDDTFLIAPTLTMRFARRTRGIAADRTYLFEGSIGLVKTMFPLHDERVGESQVSMKNNSLVRFGF